MGDIYRHGDIWRPISKKSLCCLYGAWSNIDEDATCPRTFVDDQGNQLNGKYNYVLHFDREQLPHVEAFWSITMYDKDFYLVQNDFEIYAIGITPLDLSLTMMGH